jgi:hypothetical protein
MLESKIVNAPPQRRREITALVSLRLPLLRNSSFLGPVNPDIRWFRADDRQICARPADFDAAPPVDTSKRRIRDRDRLPANEASTISGAFLAHRRTGQARGASSVRRENLL